MRVGYDFNIKTITKLQNWSMRTGNISSWLGVKGGNYGIKWNHYTNYYDVEIMSLGRYRLVVVCIVKQVD